MNDSFFKDMYAPFLIAVPPVFEMSPTSVTVQIGDEVTLECAVDGYPIPSVTWEHYGMVVREKLGVEIIVEIVNSTVMSTLYVMSVQTDNFGQYTCRVNSVLVSEPVTISFAGKLSIDMHISITQNYTFKVIDMGCVYIL